MSNKISRASIHLTRRTERHTELVSLRAESARSRSSHAQGIAHRATRPSSHEWAEKVAHWSVKLRIDPGKLESAGIINSPATSHFTRGRLGLSGSKLGFRSPLGKNCQYVLLVLRFFCSSFVVVLGKLAVRILILVTALACEYPYYPYPKLNKARGELRHRHHRQQLLELALGCSSPCLRDGKPIERGGVDHDMLSQWNLLAALGRSSPCLVRLTATFLMENPRERGASAMWYLLDALGGSSNVEVWKSCAV